MSIKYWSIFLLLFSANVFSQKKNNLLKGMYLQWGYNTEWYTRSNIHVNDVVDGVEHQFTLYHAKAHDRNDMDAILKKPIELSIPQYNYRLGFYINTAKTKSVEINFDHTKYIVYDDQLLHAQGKIGNTTFDTDTAFTHDQFHFEHTNGANFYHINYVSLHKIRVANKDTRFSALWKAGAGFMIPKTDVTLSHQRIDNRFHVAGYCIGLEGGVRWYFSKKFFLETTGKTGFVNYTNSLAVGPGKINHSFGYLELIGLIGYDIDF